MAKRKHRPVSWLKISLLALIASAFLTWRIWDSRQPGSWQHVFATREGDIGHVTSTLMTIKPDSRFVALPHPKALGKLVEIRHGDRVVIAEVLDVGPWNIDDAYWEKDRRPASETGHGAYRTPSNTAGIDLSDPVFAELGLHDNDYVEWRFVRRGFTVLPRL
ncbi:MAG: hypothetical protein QM831_32150 [Kofleriaceae bacterium]